MSTLSNDGLLLLEQLEAPGGKPCLKVYKDSAGVWTNGFGHTGPDVTANSPDISPEEAVRNLQADVSRADQAVSSGVKVETNQNQHDALVIFAFNVGVAAFLSSTLLTELNKGNYAAVPTQLMRWNKATVDGKKVVVPGLTNRRAAEVALWTKVITPTADNMPTANQAPEIASPPAPIAPAASVVTTKTGATLIGTLTTGGGAAVLQGIAQGQEYKNALDGVLGGTATGKQWYLVLCCVLVAAAVGFSLWTFVHKARSMKS